ncbi:serine hydrolase domain-containing protein [Flavobacterium microcysteis]|uniref:Serine hydrolase n=1 Tax=Flavobacterium microcysteis TaxID=2596891 RepID=A0A501QGV1_9FLAO|nr:serine hydrolase [Flavobacterium microcysteis]TPD71893.1 serine hydrolase [Flavobacterium microcysteis]
MKKKLKIAGILLAIMIVYLGFTNYPKLDLISGFSAKSIASGYFIGHRSQQMIESGDNDIKLITLASNTIHEKENYASTSVYGLKERKAIYREGLGVTLIDDSFDFSKPYLTPKRAKINSNLPYPYGNNEPADTTFAAIDYSKLNKAIENAFDKKGEKNKRTRSLLIIYKDKIVGEKYDSGFDKNSRILGWSMTKSLTATYFGILQKQGKIDIYKPAPIAEWKNDKRSEITINDLLHMNSGLEWEEKYDKICDATLMLFQAEDMAKVQREKPLVGKPNESWNYSSGTTNLLSGILRSQFKTQQEYLDFWYSSLIDKIGMDSMLVETDMAGNYVGSSYAWATTRDWGKFGLLYLHKGNWNGEQLFDENWADYVATPTSTSKGRYGGHFWLNAGGKYPDAPKDLYYASGFQGQKIFIIPSKDLVIVRFGLTDDEAFDFNKMLKGILDSIKK